MRMLKQNFINRYKYFFKQAANLQKKEKKRKK